MVHKGMHIRQRANDGQVLPRSMGLLAARTAARARARQLESPTYPQLEPPGSEEAGGSVE